jgi:carboxymethylenebutenolidase
VLHVNVKSWNLATHWRAQQAHYAGEDERINAGIPEFEAALKKASVEHEIHVYDGARHGFMNNTKDGYNEGAAKLALKWMIAFFKEKLK